MYVCINVPICSYLYKCIARPLYEFVHFHDWFFFPCIYMHTDFCMYVCIYIYIYKMYRYTYICLLINIRKLSSPRTWAYPCISIHIHVYISIYLYICTYIYQNMYNLSSPRICTYLWLILRPCIYLYTSTRIYIHMHIHNSEHTPGSSEHINRAFDEIGASALTGM